LAISLELLSRSCDASKRGLVQGLLNLDIKKCFVASASDVELTESRDNHGDRVVVCEGIAVEELCMYADIMKRI
jgi:hypothetical protein